MITIIDYGSGNVNAYAHIFKKLSIPFNIANSIETLNGATKLILPGVGAFDQVMTSLNQSGMRDALDKLVLEKNMPIMGVCVGMQIMACDSEEGSYKGLGWVKGTVKKINAENLRHKPKIPHMGWNKIRTKGEYEIFNDINKEKGFYFLHSYYFECADSPDELATVEYGDEITCAIHTQNIYGFQFHPEKSHANGVSLIKNFAGI